MTTTSIIKSKKSYISTVITTLKKTYPDAKIALTYKNTWELLVAVILSAQCTDKMVNKVTKNLFTKYLKIDDYANVGQEEFEKDIKSTGFYRNKAKNIIAASRLILDKHNGIVPKTMDEILTVPGVARKTANVVLGNAYNRVEGIAVDTHVLRISQRLRLVNPCKVSRGKKPLFVSKTNTLDYYKDADPVKVENQLMGVISKKDWFRITYLLINHGRTLCKAQNPSCSQCPLSTICPVSRTKIR